jgi:hypothetical protein
MNNKITVSIFSALLMLAATSCNKNIEGCTDSNADNFNSKANKNLDCRYRFASNFDISDIPMYKADGTAWDNSDGPDIRVNFGKKSNSGYDYSSTTSDNVSSTTTVTNPTGVKFTNEDWKYEIVDKDVVGAEVISSGTFNPITTSSSSSSMTVQNNGVTIVFKYTIQ